MRDEREPSSRIPPKAVRLQEFLTRLDQQPPFSNLEDAYAGLVSILESVEDELTGIPNAPHNWKRDGRLYPPQQDHWFSVPGYPKVTEMRTLAHNIYIAVNGAIEIQYRKTGFVVLRKAGLDGGKVWER